MAALLGNASRLVRRVIILSWAASFLILTFASISLSETSDLRTGDLYALLVGVSNFKEGSGIRSLSRPAHDVQTFGEFINSQKKVFRQTYVTTLTNERATQTDILIQIDEIAKKAKSNDTVIFFFSGHGASDPKNPKGFYFLPYDARKEHIARSSVNMGGLEFLGTIQAKRLLVIADACHSGGYFKWPSKSVHDPVEMFRQSLADSRGMAVIMSSAGDELSWEPPSLDNSLFTHFLLKGLRGEADRDGDGIITLSEAYRYASEEVRVFSDRIQNPILVNRTEAGSFPLSFVGKSDPRQVLVRMLHQLVASGKVDDVVHLIKRRPYILDDRDVFTNESALIIASKHGHTDIVSFLLGKGANPEVRDNSRNSPLIVAAQQGHPDTVELLLKSGVAVDAKNDKGDTALHSTTRQKAKDSEEARKYKKIVELLLERKATVDARNEFGSTPLGLATWVGDIEIVKVLLKHGADPNAKDAKDRTPFITACRFGHADVVRLLLANGADVKTLFMDHQQPTLKLAFMAAGRGGSETDTAVMLIEAAIKGDVEKLGELLKTGVNVNAHTKAGDTALTLAAGLGYKDVVAFLLDHGAKINQATASSQTTPLMWAAFNGKLEVVRALTEREARVDLENSQGFTALMLAAEGGHKGIVKLLHEKGAKLNAKNAEGNSALTLAVAAADKPAVNYLLEQGPELETRTKDKGSTALLLAVEKGNLDIARLLLEKGADIHAKRTDDWKDSTLTLACSNGDEAMVKLLLNGGADVNSSNRRGPAIVLAAEKGHTGVVKLLLAMGAKVTVKDWEGFTPRQVASRGGHEGVVDLLNGK